MPTREKNETFLDPHQQDYVEFIKKILIEYDIFVLFLLRIT